MSLPVFTPQTELFSTAGLAHRLFGPTNRYRLFAQKIYPALVRARAQLERCYCADDGRAATEPVLLLGVSFWQHLDNVPDRQAVELLQYHAGWNLALNRNVGDPVFHPTTLVNFRHRIEDHDLSALGFNAILEALLEAGLVSRQSRQRLDSTQMFGRVSRMNRLDCVRETLRLALREVAQATRPEDRPDFWPVLWERYVDSKADYGASRETLGRKLGEAGQDVHRLLQWLSAREHGLAEGEKARLLARVFGEQFEVVAGTAAPKAKEPLALAAVTDAPAATAPAGEPESPPPAPAVPAVAESKPLVGEAVTASATAGPASPDQTQASGEPAAGDEVASGPPVSSAALAQTRAAPSLPSAPAPVLTPAPPAPVRPKGAGELASDRVQNPHDPDATYAAKGHGEQKKEHVGYKVQVAETVTGTVLAPGEPTDNFLTGIVTHAARESDEEGAEKMTQEQQALGLDKPPVQYVDAAYISTQKLREAALEGRELIGPAPAPGGNNAGRFGSDQFDVRVEVRQAVCPAGHLNSQCSRLVEQATGRVSFRLEWSSADCAQCPVRAQCIKAEHSHRTLVVGEHHTILQQRRREQQTEPFQERMKHRNAIEGTQSELVRAHGMRRARSRGLAKVKLQNYFSGAACNIKRWLRRAAWQLQQQLLVTANLSAAG